MRGNESKLLPMEAFAVLEFTIPMRGNEIRRVVDGHNLLEVHDPHEG